MDVPRDLIEDGEERVDCHKPDPAFHEPAGQETALAEAVHSVALPDRGGLLRKVERRAGLLAGPQMQVVQRGAGQVLEPCADERARGRRAVDAGVVAEHEVAAGIAVEDIRSGTTDDDVVAVAHVEESVGAEGDVLLDKELRAGAGAATRA